jgi:hypothetical protein
MQLDKERQTYGMKESNLARFYVEILDIAPTSEDALLLINWRRPALAVRLTQRHDRANTKYSRSAETLEMQLALRSRIAVPKRAIFQFSI